MAAPKLGSSQWRDLSHLEPKASRQSVSASVGASSGKAPVTAPVAVQGTIQAQLVSANFERRGGPGQCGRKSGGGGSGAAASGPSDWPRRGLELFDIFCLDFSPIFL